MYHGIVEIHEKVLSLRVLRGRVCISAFFCKIAYGMQRLFNIIRPIKCMVISR